MSPLGLVLSTVLIPLGAAAITLLAARWICRRVGVSDGMAVALAVGVGYLAGHLGIAWPGFPPIDVTDRVAWLAAAAILVGLFEAARPGWIWLKWAARAVLTTAVLGAMLGPIFEETRQTWVGLAWLAGVGIALLASWANVEGLASRLSAASLGLAMLIVAGGAAGALVVSGSLVLGRFGAALAASLGAAVGLNLWASDASP